MNSNIDVMKATVSTLATACLLLSLAGCSGSERPESDARNASGKTLCNGALGRSGEDALKAMTSSSSFSSSIDETSLSGQEIKKEARKWGAAGPPDVHSPDWACVAEPKQAKESEERLLLNVGWTSQKMSYLKAQADKKTGPNGGYQRITQDTVIDSKVYLGTLAKVYFTCQISESAAWTVVATLMSDSWTKSSPPDRLDVILPVAQWAAKSIGCENKPQIPNAL